MTNTFRRFLSDLDGATAIEYGLIGALLTVAIVAGFGAMSTELTTLFGTATNALANPTP